MIKIWESWNIINQEYSEGLEYTLLKKKKKKEEKKFENFSIKKDLEIYEDNLLEIISENPEEIKNLSKAKGLSDKGELKDLISKLIGLKEQTLINQYQIVLFFLI